MQVEIKHGSILCAKCNTTLREAGLCPNCKYPSACIKIGYKGKTYWYYLDDNLKAYDYGAALDAVIAINREIAVSDASFTHISIDSTPSPLPRSL